MTRIRKFFKIIIFDTLAIIFMIVALLTGWLPGPGGIPLFIVGLTLFAVNHEWAEKYVNLLREYADKLGDLIFRPRLRLFFDLLAPTLLVWGFYILVDVRYNSIRLSGITLMGLGIIIFFGNRNRWSKFKKQITKQS